MLRYKLRTLLLLLAILPPLLWFGWSKYEAWTAEEERLRTIKAAELADLSIQLLNNKVLAPLKTVPGPQRQSVDMDRAAASDEARE